MTSSLPPTGPGKGFIQDGAITLPIYTSYRKGKLTHEIRYKFAGQVIAVGRTKWDEILTEGTIAISRMMAGKSKSRTICDEELFIYERALKYIEKTGIPLDEEMKFLAELRTMSNGRCPRPMVADYMERNPDVLPDMGFREASLLWLDDKVKSLCADQSIRSYGARIKRFVKVLGGTVQSLRGKMIQEKVESFSENGSTRTTYRLTIFDFLHWCVKNKRISATQVADNEVATYDVEREDTAYYSPADLTAILGVLGPIDALVVVLMAFGALRWDEITRLKWSDFDWVNEYIKVPVGVGKTRKKRAIKICDALMPFLLPWRGCRGPVLILSIDRLKERIAAAILKLGLAPIGNGFRHSFGTFRVAQTNQAFHTVSYEMGNSPEIVEEYYDGMVLIATDRVLYWTIVPQAANWTMPGRMTERMLRKAWEKRAPILGMLRAVRRKKGLPTLSEPVARAEALKKIAEAASGEMKGAPMPDFSLLANWAAANNRRTQTQANEPAVDSAQAAPNLALPERKAA